MKRILSGIMILAAFAACNNGHSSPDVSEIKVDLNLQRFEKAFFSLDTSNMQQGLLQLQQGFPGFASVFTESILGAGSINDTNLIVQTAAKAFLTSYQPVYASLQQPYASFNEVSNDLKKGFQYVKYYFPSYKVPKVITYIGPFDAPGVAITPDALAIGLQLFGGKDYAFYTSEQGQQLYPSYISRRFEKQYIASNAMMAVSQDMFPEKTAGVPMVEQMIEKGKYWYLVNHFLPNTADSIITGYTNAQLEWLSQNEGMIWSMFLQNDLLYNTDPSMMQLYIGESPHTQGFPDASPGNIGQWVGWQLVKKWADKNEVTDLAKLMQTPAKQIFQEAKYKPK